jgi:hypothetical protein
MWLLALEVSLNAVLMNVLDSVIIFIVFIAFLDVQLHLAVSLYLTVNKGVSVNDIRCLDHLKSKKIHRKVPHW